MEYSIGAVARTLGLTTVALHYFEKEGLILPLAETGKRRIYGSEDVIRLISSRKYRSMELSVKEIADQFSPNGNSIVEVRDKLMRQTEVMRQTKERYQMLEEEIGWFASALAQSLLQKDSVDICSSPECYSLCCPPDGFISRRKQEQLNIASWLENMPSTHLSVFASAPDRALFGYSIGAERCRMLGLHHTPGAVLRPAVRSLHSFVSLPFIYYDHPEMAFAALYRYAEEHQLTVAGDGYGVNLAVSCVGDRRDTTVELWLPIA